MCVNSICPWPGDASKILVGISAGANVFAACGIAGSLSPEQVVLTVLPDTGERYLSLSQ